MDTDEQTTGAQNTVAVTPVAFHIDMSSERIFNICKDDPGPSSSWSPLGDGRGPPEPPSAPETQLSDEQLAPCTPFILLHSRNDAYSPQLKKLCYSHPITVIRGLNTAINLNLGLFSTKAILEAGPRQFVEQRTQFIQSVDENYDMNGNGRVWAYHSKRSQTNVRDYACYQAKLFQNSLGEEQEKSALVDGLNALSDSVGTSGGGPAKRKRQQKRIRFATNVDLSDQDTWRAQLDELYKLPHFCNVSSVINMLTYVGHAILGMNTVQLYMKVPGCRTPAHQENNNFCSVNINAGPGDCEWFGVQNDYWGVIEKLCKRHEVNFILGSWWPDTAELRAHGVPVYRFTQRPGDLVWLNPGCVHWVQATGFCNNIAWNVGPITASQYTLALERYEWNKVQKFVSLVPMVHLTWNLARTICVSDPSLHSAIRTCLMHTLRGVAASLAVVKAKNVPIRFQGRLEGEMSHYCAKCKQEVWQIMLFRMYDHCVYCLACAEECNPSLQDYLCLEEYDLDKLTQVYDKFTLYERPTVDLETPMEPPLPELMHIQPPLILPHSDYGYAINFKVV